MRKGFIPVLSFICVLSLAACNDGSPNKKVDGEPIVLGDPSTIVTEKDSAYLRDMVADLKPTQADKGGDTATRPADTANRPKPVVEVQKPADQPAAKAGGLNIAFKEVSILIPGVMAKNAGNTNLEKAQSATYQLSSGEINGNSLQLSGATITNVSMRYQSVVNIKNTLGTLELDDLGATSGWKTIKGNNNTYTISGLESDKLATTRVTPNAIRNAISKEARQRRMNKKTQQQWQNSVKNVRSANQKPLEVALRAVMFKIDGKDKAGKSFSKQVRIDI